MLKLNIVRTDQDSDTTTLVPGVHEFGRGVFLNCNDKRVSHRHGQLALGQDNKITLTALHRNPCFVTVKDTPGLIVLTRGMSRELKEGDEFGLLPDSHWYRLTSNEDLCDSEALEETKPDVDNPETTSPGTELILTENIDIDEKEDKMSGADSHSPDMQSGDCSSGGKQPRLSTDGKTPLHIDGETQFQEMSLHGRVSSAPTHCDKDDADEPWGAKRLRRSNRRGCADKSGAMSKNTNKEEDRKHKAKTHKASTHESSTHKASKHKASTLAASTNEASKHEASTHEASTHEASMHEASTHEASTHEASMHEARTHEAAAHGATTHEATTHKATAHGATTHEATTHGATTTHETTTHGATTHEASTHIASMQEKPNLDHSALTGDDPEDIMNCAIDSDDEDDYVFYLAESTGAVQPSWTTEDIENIEIVLEDQGGCQAGDRSGTVGVLVEEVSVVAGEEASQAGSRSVQEVAGQGGSRSVQEAARAAWDVAGPSRVQLQGEPRGTQRVCDTASLNSDDSEFDVDLDDEIFEGDAELGIPDKDDYTLFVSDSNVPDDDAPFVWGDVAEYAASREAFNETVGPTSSFMDPYSAFTAIWDERIMTDVCTETNRYFAQEMEREVRAEHSPTNYWKDTRVDEMYTFFAIILLMGIVQMPSIDSYFSVNYLLHHPAFGYIMSKNRYKLLSAFLHFANNEDLQSYTGDRKLFKMQSIIDHCNRKFKELYIPSQNIAIDESLTLWKGRLTWKQYVTRKATRFGIKTFELCESATGYMWSFVVYTGRDTVSTASDIVPRGSLKSTGIVLTLIEPLLHKGYTLWMDNWFNSPWLARFLKNRRTDCVGTLNSKRKELSDEMRSSKPESGAVRAFFSACVSVFSWMDKKRVLLISTFHENVMASVGRHGQPARSKPEIVRDYNTFMGGGHKKDQMLSAYLVERKRSKKWFVKFFKRLLNVSVLNAKIIYEASAKHKIGHLEFRLKLIDAILQRHLHLARPSGPPVPQNILNRYSSNTPLNLLPPGAHSLQDLPKRKECVVCKRGKCRKMTNYQCKVCEVPLCVTPCYDSFHSPEFANYFSAGKMRRKN